MKKILLIIFCCLILYGCEKPKTITVMVRHISGGQLMQGENHYRTFEFEIEGETKDYYIVRGFNIPKSPSEKFTTTLFEESGQLTQVFLWEDGNRVRNGKIVKEAQ